MRLGWRIVMVTAVIGLGCAGGRLYPTERLGSATLELADLRVTVALELHGEHTAAHMGPEFRTMPARDFWAYAVRLEVDRGGAPVVIREAALTGEQPAGGDAQPLRDAFQAQGLETCVGREGFAYRVPDSTWTALFPLGSEVVVQTTTLAQPGCATIEPALESAVSSLLESPGNLSICRLLDEAGQLEPAMRCVARAPQHDGIVWTNPPEDGFAPPTASELTFSDRDLLSARVKADPARQEALSTLVLEGHANTEDVVLRSALLTYYDDPGRLALARRIERACADPARPCSRAALLLAADVFRPNGYEPPPDDLCTEGMALAQAVWSRASETADGDAFVVVRAMSHCRDAEALAPLMIRGLGTRTSPDQVLQGTAVTFPLSSIDANCRPSQTAGQAALVESPTLCGSFSRLAGTWLAAHCSPEAIARAKEVAGSAPALDPREDQLLDGALRVLAACDPAEFERAIAAAPDDTPYDEGTRGKVKLRAAYGVAQP